MYTKSYNLLNPIFYIIVFLCLQFRVFSTECLKKLIVNSNQQKAVSSLTYPKILLIEFDFFSIILQIQLSGILNLKSLKTF